MSTERESINCGGDIMMVKKGITEKNLEQSKTKMAQSDQDMSKCPHCGLFYSKKSVADTGGKCPHCSK